jgi:glycosyltransferase involved in cell wall biosynthesis
MIYPPRWLVRLAGNGPARLATFGWTALRRRPELIGGFHLQLNALAATWLARLIGARSAYFCVGGPREVVDGGVWSESQLFGRLPGPDPVLERRLLQAVRETDLVITMGSRACAYFAARTLPERCHVVAGGIDTDRFGPTTAAPDVDLLFVGRLAPIKRVDLFLRTVALVKQSVGTVRAAVVGDGPLRPDLEDLASRLGLAGHVTFTGRHDDVASWLRRAKVFMLTSESEGLSLSLMEAMCCGVAPVVADVGDLKDLVTDGESGYVVGERTPEAFAAPVLALLQDPERLARTRAAALRAAAPYTDAEATARWNRILAGLREEQA